MPVAENHHYDWKQATIGVRRLIAPAVLLLVMVGFYWKITLTRQYTWLDSPDLAYQVLPWFQFQAQEWHRGHFPMWDPYEWGGQSLIGQAQPGAAYPPNWILFLLPLKDGRIRLGYLHWYYVLIHYMGALFCYLLCRDLKRSTGASLLAGAAFGLAGWMGSVEWPQMVNGAVWAPLVFLFLLRAARAERPVRNAVLAGACLGVSVLSGHHQIPTFLTLACAGVWLYLFFRGGRWHREYLAPAAGFGAFFLLTGALQSLPAYEYGRNAIRWVGGPHPVGWNEPVPYLVHADFGLGPLSLLGIVIPGILRHADGFLGVVVVTLALLGIAARWTDFSVRIVGAVALGGLIFSLSRYAVFQGILYAIVPMVDKARNPSMAIFVFHFGFIVLSAYGIDCYADISERAGPAAVKFLLGFAAVVGVGLFGVVVASAAPAATDARDKMALVAFTALLLAGILLGWRRGMLTPRAAIPLLLGLLLLETGTESATFGWHHREQGESRLNQMAGDADVLQFLRNDKSTFRVEVDSGSVPYNWGDWQGMDAFDTYLASLTMNVDRVQGNAQARMLYGNKYVLSRKPTRPGETEVFAGQSGLKVYLNREAFPRTWTVHGAIRVRNAGDAGAYLDGPLADLRSRVVLEGETPPLDTCSLPDQTTLSRHDSNHVVIETEMGCRGMVILGDTWEAGWKASVDGAPAPIYEADTFLRGVVVPPGKHRIDMRYRPGSVVWGGLFSGLGLCGAGLAVAFRPKRSHS